MSPESEPEHVWVLVRRKPSGEMTINVFADANDAADFLELYKKDLESWRLDRVPVLRRPKS